MNRRNFIAVAAGTVVLAASSYYLSTDKRNFVRGDSRINTSGKIPLTDDERIILYLASLAPSGHNTQPWLVKYIEPYHWIICNDRSKWLLGVDPTQRETILSIGAFLQNLEYAAYSLKYDCQFTILATTRQDEDFVEVRLSHSIHTKMFDIQKIEQRRTVRSDYSNDILRKEDVSFLMGQDAAFIQFIPNSAKEHQWLNEQTIEANRIQVNRDDVERELANWIRFSNNDAKAHCDGLTLASMEIEGINAWYLRNFYGKSDVMNSAFKEASIETVIKQVSQSAGWLIIRSRDESVVSLLETGKLFQRLLLKIRERNIAIHPMTQILEESVTQQKVNSAIGGSIGNIQFILRTGYINQYPSPVSLRRQIEEFVRKV